MNSRSLAEKIDALLPQTQCTKCGYAGCRPYAEAISTGAADINQCPPGGEAGIRKLAELLSVKPKPLNPDYGSEQPRKVAFIIEQDCIGCTKCLPPCPVDAILGANKHMHTVIETECTGCELCIAPCPVNCIIMQDPVQPFTWNHQAADHARKRHQAKQRRLEKQQQEKAERLKKQKQMLAKLKAKKNT
ncbi:electron transport complex subunit RsxB [Methylomarinum sp. Ch1-1]|uniref:Electron transport complex subunit RsxB n=1 Tax=Methylomarinum roseum TaxID=3067653 RepID=A0AAU7NVN0_9GAMM